MLDQQRKRDATWNSACRAVGQHIGAVLRARGGRGQEGGNSDRRGEGHPAKVRRLTAGTAGKSAEAAAGVLALGLDGQGMQEAEGAWLRAMAAATAADAEHPTAQ